MPDISDWERLAVRVGTVIRAELNEGSQRPSYALWIDFGELGELQSSAQLTDRYQPQDLVGRQVVAVTGFPPLRVGGFRSDVLVLGALVDGAVVLLQPDSEVPPGSIVA
jgi:tRNA-binding protein